MSAENEFLQTFVVWAAAKQRQLLSSGSPYVTSLKVGRATPNRAVTLTVERFVVEPTGWIGDKLEEGGDLIVWENGHADATWADANDLSASNAVPSYFQHWDGNALADFESAFVPFTQKFLMQQS